MQRLERGLEAACWTGAWQTTAILHHMVKCDVDRVAHAIASAPRRTILERLAGG